MKEEEQIKEPGMSIYIETRARERITYVVEFYKRTKRQRRG